MPSSGPGFSRCPTTGKPKWASTSKTKDGRLSNAKIRKTFNAACEAWNCDPEPHWKNGKKHEPLALWMTQNELGERKMTGTNNNRHRGRTRLAWRVGGGRPLDSLLIRE